MPAPSWAYHLEVFDPAPDDELVCSVCHCVFCDPVQSSCDHVFCRHCISTWLASNHTCPICRKWSFSIQDVIPLVRNMILKLTLRCHNEACQQMVTLESCESHVKQCCYEVVRCKYKCGSEMPRHKMQEHERYDCPFRHIQCPQCGLQFEHQIPPDHNCIAALKYRLEESAKMILDLKKRTIDLQYDLDDLKKKKLSTSSTSTSTSSLANQFAELDTILEIQPSSDTSDESDAGETLFEPRRAITNMERRLRDYVVRLPETTDEHHSDSVPETENQDVNEPQVRRVPKRRLIIPNYDSSDEDSPPALPPMPKQTHKRGFPNFYSPGPYPVDSEGPSTDLIHSALHSPDRSQSYSPTSPPHSPSYMPSGTAAGFSNSKKESGNARVKDSELPGKTIDVDSDSSSDETSSDLNSISESSTSSDISSDSSSDCLGC